VCISGNFFFLLLLITYLFPYLFHVFDPSVRDDEEDEVVRAALGSPGKLFHVADDGGKVGRAR
jgi:hypothetical protein